MRADSEQCPIWREAELVKTACFRPQLQFRKVSLLLWLLISWQRSECSGSLIPLQNYNFAIFESNSQQETIWMPRTRVRSERQIGVRADTAVALNVVYVDHSVLT